MVSNCEFVTFIFPQNAFCSLQNDSRKRPYNWVIRLTLVMVINNVCVSKYAYAAVTFLNEILKTYIFHLQVRDAAKLT